MSRFLDYSFRFLALRSCALSAAVLAIAGQLALSPSVLHAQVTFSGVQTTVTVNQTITPGGLSLDQAGNLDFFDGTSSSILQIPVAGGTPAALQAQAAGPAVAWDSEGANGTLVYLSSNPSYPNWIASVDDVGGTFTAPNFIAGPEASTSAVASVALTAGPDTLVVFSDSTGQLNFTTRSSGVWATPANISGALTTGPLSIALLPLSGGGAFLAFEGTDFNFYWSQYASGSWTAVAPFTSPNIASPAGSGPIAMALDNAGDLFVSDTNNSAVWEYPWSGPGTIGTVSTLPYTTPTQLGASLNGPTGLAPDNQGNLYVADTGNGRILKIHLQGANLGAQTINTTSASIPITFAFGSTTTLGATTVLTNGLTGMDFADAGTGNCTSGTTINAGDSCTVNITFKPSLVGYRNGAVVLQDNSGNELAMTYFYGQGLGPQLSFLPGTQTSLPTFEDATNLAVDASGDIYYSLLFDLNISELVFSGGTYTDQFTAPIQLNGEEGLAGLTIDGAGSVYAAATFLEKPVAIGKFPPAPIFSGGSWTSGIGGVNSQMFLNQYVINPNGLPNNMGVDGNGNLYFISQPGQVLKASLNGNTYSISVIYQWSPGKLLLNYLAVDSAGNLYVSIGAGSTQKWTPTGSGYTQSTISTEGGTLAVDGNGVLYIGSLNTVYRETPSAGGYSESVVVSGLNSFATVAVDEKGVLYVGDKNSRVLKVDFTVPPATPFPTATDLGTLDAADGTETVQAINLGNQPLKFTKVAYPTDFPEAGGDAKACTSSTTLDASQQCDLPIEFVPQTAGSLSENVTITDNTLGAAGSTQLIPVSGTGVDVASHFSITTGATVVAGSPFTITVTALDGVGNLASGYNGTVSFTSSDAGFVNPGPLTLSSGTGQTTVTLKTAGAQTITATDTTIADLSSAGSFTVKAAAATSLQISGAASSETSGQPFAFTVKACDVYGNTATGYTGTLHFTSSDASAKLPADSTLTNGRGAFAATLVTSGTQSITATDTVNTALTATGNYMVTTQQVAVPGVVGDTQAAATTAITGAGLMVGTVTNQSSSTVPNGDVISESPNSGTMVNAGSAVNLVVSTGPAQVAVPNVVGDTKAAATSAITGAGLVLGTVTTASSSTVASGKVISESPNFGTLVSAGSAVNIVISTGPAGYLLTIAASPIDGGSVTPASGGLYAPGTVVKITATPAPGFMFSGWTGSPKGVASSSKESTTVTMNAAETVTAKFIPTLSLIPGSLNIGPVYEGTTSVKDINVKNLGTEPLAVSSPTISNITEGSSAEYVLSNGCPKTLAGLTSCTIKLSFKAGAFYKQQTATLNVGSTPGLPQTLDIHALVIDPQAKLSETSLSFGSQKEGTSSTAKSVTITNPGATPLLIGSIDLAGTDPNDFEKATNCSGSLAAGSSCTIEVTFKPTKKGSRTAKLVIEDNAESSSQTVSLSGTGD